jgi:hypothetical protein
MINRILRDDPFKGDMHNRQRLSGTLLWEALTDYDLWPISLLGLTWTIPNTPIQAYLTLVLKGLGFSTFQTNLLIIPAYVLFLCQLIFWTWFSEKLNNRFFCVLCSQIWMFPFLIALEVMGATQGGPWACYALSILLYGFPTSTPSSSPSRRATRIACAPAPSGRPSTTCASRRRRLSRRTPTKRTIYRFTAGATRSCWDLGV